MNVAQGLTFDLTINIGHLITILTIIAGGFGFIMTMQRRLDAQSGRLQRMEQDFTQMAAETQNDIKRLTDVVITQARHDERITAIDHRLISQGRRLDDAVRRMNIYLDIRGAVSGDDDPAN